MPIPTPHASNERMIAIPGSSRKPMPGARLVGKSDPTERIKASIYVRRNPNPPAAVVSSLEVFTSKLPGERRALTNDEFNSVYGADPSDLSRVAAWAEKSKLTVLDKSVAKRRILVEGTIEDIQNAFDVQLNEYEHTEQGHFRGREGEARIPSDLAGVIQGVFGLDTRRIGQSRRKKIEGRRVSWKTPESLEARQKRDPTGARQTDESMAGHILPPADCRTLQLPDSVRWHRSEHRHLRI